MTLMQSAPSLNWVRMAVTTSSAESASVPNILQWPPVVVIGVPATTILGPGTMPFSTADLMGSMTSFLLPRSRMVVTPELRAARTADTPRMMKVSLLSVVM